VRDLTAQGVGRDPCTEDPDEGRKANCAVKKKKKKKKTYSHYASRSSAGYPWGEPNEGEGEKVLQGGGKKTCAVGKAAKIPSQGKEGGSEEKSAERLEPTRPFLRGERDMRQEIVIHSRRRALTAAL